VVVTNRIRAVVFDYGHTLARYDLGTWDSRLRQGLERVHTALAEVEDLPPLEEFTAAAIEQIRGPNKDTAVYPLERRLHDLMERLGLDSEILVGRLSEILLSPVLEIGKPDRDAHEVLQTLKERGMQLGLISNCPWCSPSRIWREEIRSFGLDRYLDSMIFCTEFGVRKPDPRIFQASLDELGVAAEAAMFVGDDQRWDVEGGNLAGMTTVWYNVRHEDPDPDLAPPDYTIYELRHLLDLPPLRRS
jgi:HAD superfamily hydrolase (TIGR01509 family)